MGITSTSPYQAQVCNECGQVWRCERISDLTVLPPKHCPGCGSLSLGPYVPGGGFQGAAFEAFNPELLRLCWEDWIADTPEAMHRRNLLGTFRAYMLQLLKDFQAQQ